MSCKTWNAFTFIIIVTLCVNLLLSGIEMCCYILCWLVEILPTKHMQRVYKEGDDGGWTLQVCGQFSFKPKDIV